MDSYQQAAPSRGVFGTKIPSSVAFTVGILLFLLPFAELKCKAVDDNQIALLARNKNSFSFSNTGLGLAIGSQWKFNMPGMNNFYKNQQNNSTSNLQSRDPNAYAIIALILAALGVGLSFVNARSGATVNIATGLLAAAALIGLMIDLKKELNEATVEKTSKAFDLADKNPFMLVFTPWFYIAVIAFIVAAFFSYKRMIALK